MKYFKIETIFGEDKGMNGIYKVIYAEGNYNYKMELIHSEPSEKTDNCYNTFFYNRSHLSDFKKNIIEEDEKLTELTEEDVLEYLL